MQQRYKRKIQKLESRISKQSASNLKHMSQKIRRKNEQIDETKAKIQQMRLLALKGGSAPNIDLHRSLKAVVIELNQFKRKHRRLRFVLKQKKKVKSTKSEITRLKSIVSKKDKLIGQLQSENSRLLEDLEKAKRAKTTTLKKGEKQQYSASLRLLVYSAICQNLSTARVSKMIKDCCNQGEEKKLEVAPSRSAVEIMAREIGIMAYYQVAEFILNQANVTLGFDATTQGDAHVNSVHVTSKESCRIIALDKLAGGTAEDYENHITESIDFIAHIYAAFNECEFEDCRHKIISNISNTMTDRATVNHATISRLELAWRKTLNELNCHLHPLETIASICKKSLKDIENQEKHLHDLQLQGESASAVNVTWNISKLRYKNGVGDPRGFVNALERWNLPKGLVPRYRGNRLHVLFHISGVLLGHYEFFQNFLALDSVKKKKRWQVP